MTPYIFIYLGSAFFALVMTPIMIWIARRLRIAAIPGNRHMHEKPISHIGGVAIFVSVIFFAVPALFFFNTFEEISHNTTFQIMILISAASWIFIIGLIDDILSSGLQARIKFIAQIVAAIAVCSAGIIIRSVTIKGLGTLHFGWFSWPLTILWIAGITNAVNLSDGLDGLAAGISAIACGAIAIFTIYNGDNIIVIIMLAMLGSITGFLFFNFNPAKIFMGDCGSMFLGFMIATFSVLSSNKSSSFLGLALPILALGIPIFDTLFSMLRRFLERRSIFSADRSHFHHRLIDLGFRHSHAVIIIYLSTLFAVGLGMLMMFTNSIVSLIIFFCVLLMIVSVFHIVGAIRLRETIRSFKQKYALNKEIQREIRNFEDAQLYFRQAKTFNQWWQAVSKAADVMGFSSLSLPLTNRDGTTQTLRWRQNGIYNNSNETVKLILPIQDRRTGPKLNLNIEVYENNCLESTGRRIALFSRLMQDHGIGSQL
jgi:UDP-GlcNAc:undecaprenyl-phosphate GlcNAc-1-phosphate transferase